jgi:hypothetical protein
MQNQHLAIKWKILWNITTLKFSQFYDGACEETPRKHSEAGESRAGCPTFFLLKKAPRLTFPEANGAGLTRRNGTDSGRPFVRRHRRQCAVTAAETDRRPGADRRTDHGPLVCGPPITPVRRQPPFPPHGPGNYGPTTHQPAHHFPLHYVGPPSYPAPSQAGRSHHPQG